MRLPLGPGEDNLGDSPESQQAAQPGAGVTFSLRHAWPQRAEVWGRYGRNPSAPRAFPAAAARREG